MTFEASIIIDRIKEKIPLKELESLGISSSHIANWKARNTIPKADDLYNIAQLIGVSMEYLLTGESIHNTAADLSNNEKTLLDNYRSLDSSTKHNVDLMVEALSGQ